MKNEICTRIIFRLLVVALLGAVSGLSVAEEKKGVKAEVKSPSGSTIVYKPPRRGAPKTRVGGGTRGPGGQEAILQVLAPDHTGLTTQSQPALYWYASSPVAARLEFSLIDEEGIDPLLEVETGTEPVTGIQKLDLGEHNISLQPDVSYQWSVALVVDDNSRSSDVIASGTIELVEPSSEMAGRIASSQGKDRVLVYANGGIWYDALDSISDLIAASPQDRELVSIRASMLEQVGLEGIETR